MSQRITQRDAFVDAMVFGDRWFTENFLTLIPKDLRTKEDEQRLSESRQAQEARVRHQWSRLYSDGKICR